MSQSVYKLYCEVRNLNQRSLISRGLLYREDRYNRKSVMSRDLLHREVRYGNFTVYGICYMPCISRGSFYKEAHHHRKVFYSGFALG